MLTSRLLRLEYAADGGFRDTATQMALCREFPVPEYTLEENAQELVLETEHLRLRYNRKPFSSTGLSAELKGAYGAYASIWHYGDPAQTLGGTARTLDEADGEIPLEDGIQSYSGYAALDDSSSMGMDETGRLLSANFALLCGIICGSPAACLWCRALLWATGGAATMPTPSRNIYS